MSGSRWDGAVLAVLVAARAGGLVLLGILCVAISVAISVLYRDDYLAGLLRGLVLTLAFAAIALLVGRRDRQADNEHPPGLLAEDQAELRAVAAEAATAVDAVAPDEIRIVPGSAVRVEDDGVLGGLRQGRRRLLIGAAALVVLSRDQLLGLTAHELAHFSTGEGRLRPVIYRMRDRILRAEEPIIGDRLALAVSARVCARQEIWADRSASELVGSEMFASALEAHVRISRAWVEYHRRFLLAGQETGLRPLPAALAFGSYFASTSSPADDPIGQDPKPARPRVESHLPLGDRVAQVRSWGLPGRVGGEAGAWRMLGDADRVLGDVDELLFGGTVLAATPWAEFVHRVGLDRARRDAVDLRQSLGDAATILEQGSARILVEHLVGTGVSDAVSEAVATNMLTGAVEAELAGRCGASYRLSWIGGPELHDVEGRRLDVRSLVAACASRSALPTQHATLAAVIDGAGIAHVIPDPSRAPVRPAVLKSGFLSLAYSGRSRVFGVTEAGLVVAPIPRDLRTRGIDLVGLMELRPLRSLERVDRAGPEALLHGRGASVTSWDGVSEVRVRPRVRRVRVRLDTGRTLKLAYMTKPHGDLRESLRVVVGNRLR
ncbi:hypothetical protein [Nocardioides sp. GXZ039]|uniref:hypothetical protein n=1 Tax=Nocardioides sp. GXZ039 TaxID=3136018 RepID=UPI0030F4197F